MLLGIDHLVIAVRDVAAAEAALERSLGLACTGGGRHEAMGTYNRLAFLGDTYLELIGVFDRSLVVSSTTFAVGNAVLAHLETVGDGLATFALASDALEADVASLQAAGSSIGSPVSGSRVRPDGDTVRWTTAFPALGPERPPFLIEHVYEGAEWGAAARAVRASFRHPGGGLVRLAGVELPADDIDALADAYGSELGIAFSEGWRTAVGRQEIALCGTWQGARPLVRLHADPGTAPLAIDLLGIRWVREPPASSRQG